MSGSGPAPGLLGPGRFGSGSKLGLFGSFFAFLGPQSGSIWVFWVRFGSAGWVFWVSGGSTFCYWLGLSVGLLEQFGLCGWVHQWSIWVFWVLEVGPLSLSDGS